MNLQTTHKRRANAHYDMILTHMTWNRSFVEAVIRPQTTFTILRNPTTQLISSWTYYYSLFDHPQWPVVEENTLARRRQLFDMLANDTDKFYSETLMMSEHAYRYVLRPQLASFGFGDKIYEQHVKSSVVNGWLEQIDRDFDLVLIMEYYDYSLALLSIELCWPLSDLANLMTNGGMGIDKVEVSMSDNNENFDDLIRQVNFPDYLLYEHFNATFWRKVKQVGIQRVDAIAKEIRQLSQQLEDMCVNGYRQIKLWNGDLAKEGILRNFSKPCEASVKWGTRQTKLLRKSQLDLMKREAWDQNS